MLRKGVHVSTKLQKVYNLRPSMVGWEILELCEPSGVKSAEKRWSAQYPDTLDTHPSRGYSLTEETKKTLREGRARYLSTPGAIESLSERAKKQWAEGNLGRKSDLTDADVAEMRLIRSEGHTLKQVARAFGISATHVSRVLRDR
jgi:AraC-like DNA-binding protein